VKRRRGNVDLKTGKEKEEREKKERRREQGRISRDVTARRRRRGQKKGRRPGAVILKR
jgi:hypothetical protein